MNLSTKDLSAIEQKLLALEGSRTRNLGDRGALVSLGDYGHLHGQDLLALVQEAIEHRRQAEWVRAQMEGGEE